MVLSCHLYPETLYTNVALRKRLRFWRWDKTLRLGVCHGGVAGVLVVAK